ncbi:hypothetical protein [Streptomyces sp. SID5643]|uniref:hypothetical protein n=1 Tax=Streptomyces sp. SID5643 TaxID=2690307 RepID=UPI00137033F9|nr:hypothetical protein [Streptomyces sp. SID5643]MZF89712.1 hypothetical protein [Streptomyces sp. SID5643]
MTEHVRDKEPGTSVEASAGIDVPGRDITPRGSRLLELLGLTLVAGAGVLSVVRPDFYEAGAHVFATHAASLLH